MRLLRHLTLLPLLAASAGGAELEPAWQAVDRARAALTDVEWEVDFTQTFVPPGFSTGESESGTASFGLPNRLRWDYETPFPRVFVVRDDMVFTWNPGEGTGRRFTMGAEEAGHLELLRLDVEQLARRYRAVLLPEDEGSDDSRTATVQLESLDESSRIREATLEIEHDSGRLKALSYRDREGNLTRFELTDFRPAEDPGRFAPPDDLDWIDS